jgi:hypothetical protein
MAFKIKVPNSLSEISLEKFQKYMKLRDENDNEEFLSYKAIELFCGIPLSDVYKLTLESVESISEVLSKMFNEQPKHVERFTMAGVEYGFIPDLNEMTLAEYVDTEGNLSDIQNLHLAMNVLYRPIKDKKGDKYNIYPYKLENLDKMKDMPTSAALGAIFFLISLGKELSLSTILSSQEVVELQAEMDSEGNGDGIHQYLLYQMEILQEWTKLQNRTSISA